MKKNNKLFIGLLILTISFAIFLLLFFRIDPDYFWHIKAGEYMFKNGIVKHDIFSWYLNSKYWMSHEWLFEIIVYSFKMLFPKYHVFVYSFLTLISLLFILLFTNKKNYLKNIPFTLCWYLVFFMMIICYLQARPHMISFSFLAITIYVLYDLYKNENSKKLYILPFITILWANIHGGSSNLTYLFCLIFIVGGSFSFKKSKIEAKRLTKKQYLKYLLIMLICMICVCINIHGIKMFVYPYENMLNKTMLMNISEWRNTTLDESFHYVYFLSILITLFIMLFSKKKINFMDLLLFLVTIYLGLKSIRFWLYFYIIMSYVIFNYIEERKQDKGTFNCLIIFSLITLAIFGMNFNKILNIKYEDMLNKEVIKILDKEKPKRLFNMYDYGGELIYNDIKVFIDGRADLYSKYNYEDYLNISNLKNDYINLIDKYNFDYFLVDKNYSIDTYLKYNNDYKIIYNDKRVTFYKKIKSM